MRKIAAKFILTLLVIAMAISIFVACETKETYSVSFVDIDDAGSVTDAMTAAQAQEYFGSLPTRQGYVFMGWYLDKDKWEQKIESTEDIEKYIVSGNVNVYAKWVPIENAITILFMDYNQASLFEYQCDRSEVNMSFLKPSIKPTDSKYTYTFDHWECDMSDLTQAFYIATPVYKEHLRVFEVKYYDQGKLINTEKVEYGKNADVFRLSNKAATAEYEYQFDGWEGVENATNVTSDVTLNAKWKQTLRSYTVTFKDGSTIFKEQKVTYGSSAIAPTNTKKKDTAQYRYTFLGWDNNFDNIRSDTVVNAIYSSTLQSYEVSFFVDDKCYYNTNAIYGDGVDAPKDPVKELNDGYIYTFNRWDKSFDRITGETRINAVFDRQAQTFDVTYYNWDGTILYNEEVETGKASIHKDDTAQRESNPQYSYQFTGWTNSDKLSDVRSNLSVYPNFKENKRTYKVTFYYGNDEQEEQDIFYGENAIEPTDVQKSETAQYKYEFKYWDASFENIQKDTVVNAVYNEIIQIYEVTFLIEGTDEHIVTRYVKYGESAIAPDPEKFAKITDDGFTYTFKEWDKSFDDIQENTTVYAKFNKISHTYEIRYVNWDGTLLYTDSVESGESSVYPNDTPEREPNTKYLYTFSGWKDKAENGKDATDALNCVTKSFAVYADYDEQIRTYTVTFDYGYDKEPVVMNVAYGTNLVGREPNDTGREKDVQFSYEFLGWAGNLGYIYEDTTITARWAETLRKY
ncbi:MAG: InlB B-repeat-containing protein, partial [Clostridia bacterium]|nr:InlB B-repeat-containing protein [Clostridia bacterium]